MTSRWCPLGLFVCNLVFDIPLHAARRVMAAAGFSNVITITFPYPGRACAIILLPPMSANVNLVPVMEVEAHRQRRRRMLGVYEEIVLGVYENVRCLVMLL